MPLRLLSLIPELQNLVPRLALDVRVLPSGVVFLNIYPGSREFVLEYSPTRGFGISENTSGTPPFHVGHEHVFDSAEPAADCLLRLVRDTISSPDTFAA